MAAMRQLLVRVARDPRAFTRLAFDVRQPTSRASTAWQLQRARHFGSGINGDSGNEHDNEWEDMPKINGDVSPFERLLQHSQQFRDEVGMDELSKDEKEDVLGENDDDDVREEEEDEQNEEHDDDNGGDKYEAYAGHHHKKHHHRSHPQKHRKEHHHQSHHARQWGLEERVRRQIGRSEDVDFEHGLRDLDERRAKEKMYLQLLRREYDRDRVCQNCGEPGHVARNCMLPVICSNCGDVGHRRQECPHRSFSVDQLGMTKKKFRGQNLSDKKEDVEARRRVELEAIRECHDRMKKAFDDELDEYLDKYEATKRTSKERSRAESAEHHEEEKL